MPEILVLPSRTTRRTYPLHLRIVCALVARLADLQVSMQHAHTARLVRNFPARYAPVERMQVQRTGDQIKVVDILACTRSHPHENMNEHCQALTTEARIRSEALAAAQEEQRDPLAKNPYNPTYGKAMPAGSTLAQGVDALVGSRPVFSGVSKIGELIEAQQNLGGQPIFTPLTKEEEDFARMRAEVAQLLEDALANTTVKRGTFSNEAPRKENPNA